MSKTQCAQLLPDLRICGVLAICLGCAALAPSLSAQATTEAAAATSVSSAIGAKIKFPEIPSIPLPGASAGSPAKPASSNGSSGSTTHISASMKGPSVESNRHALEAKAGKDGARLLIRSIPSEAQIWIDDKPVGTTPLLLIVPPGKFMLELRGTRQESAKEEIAILPNETREVAVKLAQRYPTRVLSLAK
jgi:PEGA domain-containing protein